MLTSLKVTLQGTPASSKLVAFNLLETSWLGINSYRELQNHERHFRTLVDKEIGMNAEKPYHLDSFTIESVTDTYFTVSREKNSNRIHIPYQNIIRVLEDDLEGIHVGGLFHQKKDYSLVVNIRHYVTSVPA